MAITEAFTFTATVSTTELSFLSGTSTLQNNTTAGVYQLWVDPSAMATGDQFLIQFYEKVLSSGTKRVFFAQTLRDSQTQNWTAPTLILMNGWDMTIIKVTGTDRSISGSVRKIA